MWVAKHIFCQESEAEFSSLSCHRNKEKEDSAVLNNEAEEGEGEVVSEIYEIVEVVGSFVR